MSKMTPHKRIQTFLILQKIQFLNLWDFIMHLSLFAYYTFPTDIKTLEMSQQLYDFP